MTLGGGNSGQGAGRVTPEVFDGSRIVLYLLAYLDWCVVIQRFLCVCAMRPTCPHLDWCVVVQRFLCVWAMRPTCPYLAWWLIVQWSTCSDQARQTHPIVVCDGVRDRQ